MTRRTVYLLSALCFLTCLSPLFGTGEQEATDKLTVFTSILPQKYFVEKIGGERIKVEVLVGPGSNPATYEPTPQQITLLGSADVFFSIGVPFEKAFLSTIAATLTSLRIVDTSAGIEKRPLDSHTSALDPHIWLSPVLVKTQAEHMYNALVEIDPEGESIYKKGYDTLIDELDRLDQELIQSLAPFAGSTLFVYHPAFGYFADRYGLQQVAIETGGKEPTPAVLEKIIEQAKQSGSRIIFVQPEFSIASARTIAAAIGGVVITLNPLNPDYINNLKTISEEIQKGL